MILDMGVGSPFLFCIFCIDSYACFDTKFIVLHKLLYQRTNTDSNFFIIGLRCLSGVLVFEEWTLKGIITLRSIFKKNINFPKQLPRLPNPEFFSCPDCRLENQICESRSSKVCYTSVTICFFIQKSRLSHSAHIPLVAVSRRLSQAAHSLYSGRRILAIGYFRLLQVIDQVGLYTSL